MKPIYYLSYSDKPIAKGFVFPSELSEDTYALGIWVIALERGEQWLDSFQFDAVDNNQLLQLSMNRVENSVFQVTTEKYGNFYFKIKKFLFHHYKYVGNSKLITPKCRLYQIVSMDTQKLHDICLNKGFFFVGRVDDKLKQ